MLHDNSFVDGCDSMTSWVTGDRVSEVLDGIFGQSLNNICLSNSGEDWDLLGAERNNGNGIGRSNLSAEGVLVSNVCSNLGSRQCERSESKSADGDTPNGD